MTIRLGEGGFGVVRGDKNFAIKHQKIPSTNEKSDSIAREITYMKESGEAFGNQFVGCEYVEHNIILGLISYKIDVYIKLRRLP